MSAAGRTSPGIRPCRSSSGFSLLELLAVLLIIAVATGVFLGYNYTQRDTVQLRSAMGELRQFLRLAQGYALLEGQENECVYDVQSHVFRESLRGRELPLPEVVVVDLSDLEAGQDVSRFITLFYPDGSSQGGMIRLGAAGQELTVRIDPVLGDTTVE